MGGLLSVDVPSLKILSLLPFAWLLLESVKRRPDSARTRSSRPAILEGESA